MGPLNWNARMETGIVRLDQVHRDLLARLAQVPPAAPDAESGADPECTRALVDLAAAVRACVADEERLMSDVAYAGRAAHRASHVNLVASIDARLQALAAGEASCESVRNEIEQALLDHVAAMDVALGAALRHQDGVVDRRVLAGGVLLEDSLLFDRRFGEYRQIEWNPALELGHPALDADHRDLVMRFNRLVDPALEQSHDAVVATLADLYGATRDHFQREEDLMVGLSAVETDSHRHEHRELLAEFSHQVEDWLARRMSYHTLTHFLYRWLLRHIVTMDRALAGHLAGLSRP